jgi:hypothetical protein
MADEEKSSARQEEPHEHVLPKGESSTTYTGGDKHDR